MKKLLSLVLCLMLLACSAFADEPVAPKAYRITISDPVLAADGQTLLGLEGLSLSLIGGQIDGRTAVRLMMSAIGDTILDAAFLMTGESSALFHMDGLTSDYLMPVDVPDSFGSISANPADILKLWEDFDLNKYVTSTYEETAEGVTYTCKDFAIDNASFDEIILTLLDTLDAMNALPEDADASDLRSEYEASGASCTLSGTIRTGEGGGSVSAEAIVQVNADGETEKLGLEFGWLEEQDKLTGINGALTLNGQQIADLQFTSDGALYQGTLTLIRDEVSVEYRFSLDTTAKEFLITGTNGDAAFSLAVSWSDKRFLADLNTTNGKQEQDIALQYEDGSLTLSVPSGESTITVSCKVDISAVEENDWLPAFSGNPVDASALTDDENLALTQEMTALVSDRVNLLFTKYPTLAALANALSANQ